VMCSAVRGAAVRVFFLRLMRYKLSMICDRLTPYCNQCLRVRAALTASCSGAVLCDDSDRARAHVGISFPDGPGRGRPGNPRHAEHHRAVAGGRTYELPGPVAAAVVVPVQQAAAPRVARDGDLVIPPQAA
jgi:hypothetical protein